MFRYSPRRQSGVCHLPTIGFALTDGFELDAGRETAYAYDDVGRFSRMSWDGPGNSYTASYAHVESSDMTAGYDIEVGSDTFHTPFDTHLIVYDGWNPVSDIVWSAGYASATTNRFVWGIDLSGTLQGAELARHSSPGATAGGIGGLVAKISGEDVFFATYDANGNVSEYLEEDGDLAAHYEYDPYGNLTASSGSAPGAFEHRFSTKWYDSPNESPLTGDGLYYYGLRFYQPGVGRWLGRDPILEHGGASLHGFAQNSPLLFWDRLGMEPRSQGDPKAIEWTPSCKRMTRSQFEEWLKQVGYVLTGEEIAELNKGCVGITCIEQGREGIPGREGLPENAPSTLCYLSEMKAQERKCPTGNPCNIVFCKQGKWKDGKEPIPGDDGTIPNDSIVSIVEGKLVWNYVTIRGGGFDGCYTWVNHGVGKGTDAQQITVCKIKCMDPHYPAEMCCSTCVAKRSDMPWPPVSWR